jgi:hypothetical protein
VELTYTANSSFRIYYLPSCLKLCSKQNLDNINDHNIIHLRLQIVCLFYFRPRTHIYELCAIIKYTISEPKLDQIDMYKEKKERGRSEAAVEPIWGFSPLIDNVAGPLHLW